MKPVTALAVIVVIFLVILGIIFWQMGLFEGAPPENPALFEPITPTDLAVITPTDLTGVPTYEPISYTGGLDQFYTPTTTQVQTTSASYTVRPGDTLWIIAQHFYNDGTKWKQIQDANKIQNPSKIKVGMTLIIPDVSASVSGPAIPGESQPAATTPPTTGGKYHTVVKGDNLWRLARKYYNDSTKTNEIFEANRDKMSTPETSLKLGWKLLIPDLPKKSSAPKTGSKKTEPKTTTTTPDTTTTPPPSDSSGWDNTPVGSGD